MIYYIKFRIMPRKFVVAFLILTTVLQLHGLCGIESYDVRFQVFMALAMKIAGIWNITPYVLVFCSWYPEHKGRICFLMSVTVRRGG
jgi:hypothetical protein